MRTNLLILILVSAGQLACSNMQRHPSSGYFGELERESLSPEDFYQERANKEVGEAMAELSYSNNRPLNEAESYYLRERLKLRKLESSLETEGNKQQYYGLKPYFKNDSERIQYLRVPSSLGRNRWAASRSINSRKKSYAANVLKAIEKNDIVENMTKNAVLESWGPPDAKEVSGLEMYGNERWKYNEYKSTSEGYKKVSKIIYFEAGKVKGWERNE